MKIKFTNILLCFMLFISLASTAQNNIWVEADGEDLYYNESGCGDEVFAGNPDPRWRARFVINGNNYDWNVSRDNYTCGWSGDFNYALTPAAPSLTLNNTGGICTLFDGFEDDVAADDASCGGYGTCGGGNTVPITTNGPYTWHFYTTTRSCSSDGTTGDWRYDWSYKWGFTVAPTVTTAPVAPGSSLCVGTAYTLTVAANSIDSWTLGRFFQWQRWNGSAYVDISGATGSSFTVPQTVGTEYYRVRITSNETADFSSLTTVSPNVTGTAGAITVTYLAATDPLCSAANCDFIYVDGTGPNNTTAGPNNPARDLTYVLNNLASFGGRTHIRMASGIYTETTPAYLASNVIVEGGFNVSTTSGIKTWSKRSDVTTTINFSSASVITSGTLYGAAVGFVAENNDDNWRLLDLTITTGNTTAITSSGHGYSNYGVYINGATNTCDNYVISRCSITSGNAANGGTGAAGRPGGNGNTGSAGSNGGCDCYWGCSGCGGGGGGAGSSSPGAGATTGPNGGGAAFGTNGAGGAGGNGGAGGAGSQGRCSGTNTGSGGDGTGGSNGSAGGSASPGGTGGGGGTTGGGGGFGNAGVSSGCSNGNNGGAGAAGVNGTNGNPGGTPGTVSFSGGYFLPTEGTNGGGGGGGKGGGGGEGGSGSTDSGTCDRDGGQGGGGGSSGGGGGGGGYGGGGGGGTFAIFIWANGATGLVTDSYLNALNVGSGGAGGAGGSGGTGPAGLGTGTGNCGSGDSGEGGGSGKGGNGGAGGAGGTGKAGIEYAIANLTSAGATTTSGPTLGGTLSAVSFNDAPNVGSVPNSASPMVITYNRGGINGKFCINSELDINRGAAVAFNLPGSPGASDLRFVDDITDGTPNYTNAQQPVKVFATTTSSNYSIPMVGTNTGYNNYIRTAADNRTAPVVGLIVQGSGATAATSVSACAGASIDFSISSGSYDTGNILEREWIVYQGTNIGAPTFTPVSSTTGTFGPFTTAGTYKVRYRERHNCCGWSVASFATITIVTDPVGPIMAVTPTAGDICAGTSVSATVNTIGSGGVGGADVFEVSTNGGNTYSAYTPGNSVSTTSLSGAGIVRIRSQRTANANLSCDPNPTGWVETVWNVIPVPTQRTVTASTPTICTGSSSDIVLTGSDNGVTYQLWNVTDNTFSATQAGTGSNLTFTTGALTATKTFKIVASVSPCANVNMNNDVAVTVTVVTSAPSAVTASANSLALCVGNSFNLNATGGTGAASWSWTGPNSYTNTNQDPAAFTTLSASAGNYVATATNVCGSTTSNTLTLGLSAAAPGAVTASANSLLLCVGSAFDLNASGGAGATSWSWSGPNSYTDSNQDPASFGTVAASAGNYTATATNACGSTSSSALALALALSTPSAVTASANSLSLCTGASFDLNASGGTGATSWSWSGPDSYTNTNQNPAAFSTSATSAGNYTATATNVCGSTSSSAITLALTASVPSAVTASANSLAMCAGSPFDLNATGGTGATSWSWSGPNGYGSTSQDPASFNTVAASGGNYLATATNVCGNATSNTLALAVTAAVPSAVTASATSANLCETQPLDLEATGGTGATSWSWTGPNSYSNSVQDPVSFITSVASAGNYVATATNICGSTVSNSLAVTVVTGPINKIVTSTTTICSGTSGTVQLVNSEPGTVYQLYNTTDNVNVGATQTGNGSTLSFSTGALANDKTYKIIGSRNPCTALDMNFGADVNVYVVTTGSWKGSLSDNWFDGGNWCLGGGIPTSSTDITIPTGSITDFDPVIASNGAVCRSINLNSGSIMTINNTRNLDVWGTWNNSGTFNYNVSTVTFKGTGNVILTGFTDPQEFYNLRVDKGTDITPLLSIETNTVVYGNLQPINGLAQVKADLELYNGPTIASTAGVEVTTDILQGNFRADGLNVTNNGLYSVISGTDSLNNLTNSSTATYTHAGGTSVLTGNVANTGATVTAAGGVLNVGGNWSNASSSTVTYSGATIAIVGDYSSSGSTVNANSATVSIGGKYTNSSSSTLSLGGAIVSVGGNYVSTGSSINQTGGAMTLNTTGASYNANAILDLDATSNLNISSGTIFFQRANGGTGNDLVIAAGGTKTITGGTFQFGNASTPASQVFKVNNSAVDFNNFNVNNSSSNNPRVQLLANAATRSTGVLTVDGVLDLNGYTFNVKNGATTGIVAGGYVISETSGGTSKLAWNIGNNTGTYVYPFGTAAGDFIPFTFSVTGAGVQSGAGNVTLSTYPTGDDNTPWVSGVQHMNFDQGPGTGTDATLDRWWIIDANNYTTRPTSNMTFKYASSDLSGNSSILEDNLKAQRWNATGGPDSLGGWDLPTEYGIVSTANAADNTVTASGVSRYSPWVLHDGESSGNSPLPIELVDFKASCTNDVVTINWTTATEINNDFFTVQRSADLATYDNVALVQGAGNSNTYRNYSAKDLYPLAGTAYYRLMQTDYNGEYEVFSPVTVSCVIKGSDVISVFPNPAQDRLNVSMNLSTSDRGRIMIYNHYGQLVESMFVEPKAGANIYDFDLGNLAQGQYFVSFSMENKVLPTQKVVITR